MKVNITDIMLNGAAYHIKIVVAITLNPALNITSRSFGSMKSVFMMSVENLVII